MDVDQNEAPVIQREMISNLLYHLEIHKSMGWDGVHPKVLRELAEVFTETLGIIYQQSWLSPCNKYPYFNYFLENFCRVKFSS